jgi:hypothetical protein
MLPSRTQWVKYRVNKEKKMERPFVIENALERKRLRDLVKKINDEDLIIPLYEGWTVAVALAHLAFWDQWSLTLLRRQKNFIKSREIVDTDVVNDTLVPLFLGIPPRCAAELALSSAEAIDKELEEAPDELISEIEKLAHPWRLYRSKHRKLHLDEIEAVLQVEKPTDSK